MAVRRNTVLAVVLSAVACGWTSGCAGLLQPEEVPPRQSEAPAEPPPQPAQAQPAPSPAPPVRPAPRPKARPAPAPSAPAGPAGSTPAKLAGLTEAETMALLGRPIQQLDAPPGKIWHYAARDCALEVYFYLDVASNRFQVVQYRAIGEAADAEASERCLQRVRHESAGK